MKYILLFSSAVIFFIGCTKNDNIEQSLVSDDFCELVARSETPYPVVTNKNLEALAAKDVIVAVNGYPLTKKMFDELMVLKVKSLEKEKGANYHTVSTKLEQFRQSYIPLFVNQRLLLDEARRLNVVSTNEITKTVNNVVAKAAKSSKKTIEQFKKAYPGDFKYFTYDIAQQVWISKLISKHIPPKIIVNDAFVSNVQAQVALENEATAKTNNMIRTMLVELKKDIAAGKVTFENSAKKFSQDSDADPEKPGFWGDFERGEMDDKRVQAVAFSLKIGEISDPVEDENGFHLIKVLKILPLERNDKGRVIRNETRTLAHIYREKQPLLIVEDNDAMFADLKRQMQLQAIDDFVANLRTNGANRVEYPHGTKLFK